MRFLLTAFLILLFKFDFGQVSDTVLVSDDSVYTCDYDYGYSGQYQQASVAMGVDNRQLIDSLFERYYCRYLGGNRNSVQIEQTWEYKYAAAGRKKLADGKFARILYYNNPTLDSIKNTYGINWVLKAIILHEICHHFNGDMFAKVNTKEAEWWADYYAGFHGRRLGATKKEMQQGIKELCKNPPYGYPSQTERLKAVSEGWEKGEDFNELASFMGRAYAASYGVGYQHFSYESMDKDFKKEYKAINLDTTIYATASRVEINNGVAVSFYLLGDSLYYKTQKGFVWAGRMESSNMPGYSFMFFDKYFNYWYVDGKKDIYYKSGKEFSRIGKLLPKESNSPF